MTNKHNCKECGEPKSPNQYDKTSKGNRMKTCKACQKIKRQLKRTQKCDVCGGKGPFTRFKKQLLCRECLVGDELPIEAPTSTGIDQMEYAGGAVV